MSIRAAFDFGSGMTKLCVAFCPHAPAHPLKGMKVLFAEEAEVLLGHSVNASTERRIDDATLRKLYQTTERLRAEVTRAQGALHFNVRQAHDGDAAAAPGPLPLEIRGLCTAVYREAANGSEAMGRLREIVGSPHVRIVTQAEEGRTGYLTGVAAAAVAASASPASSGAPVVVWDSGGSSFQITSAKSSRDEDSMSAEGELNCVQGNWGSSKALHATMTVVRGVPSADARGKSPNPMTPADCAKLGAHIRARLQKDRILFPTHEQWLRPAAVGTMAPPAAEWVAIGGPSCAFRMAAIAVHGRDTVDRLARAGAGCSVDAAALRAAVLTVACGKSDAELSALGFVQPAMVVSKIVLVLTVMEELQLPRFTFHLTTGSTLGMIGYPPLWRDAGEATRSKL